LNRYCYTYRCVCERAITLLSCGGDADGSPTFGINFLKLCLQRED